MIMSDFFHFHSRRRAEVVVAKFNDADVEIGDIMSRIRRHNTGCVIMVAFFVVVVDVGFEMHLEFIVRWFRDEKEICE